MDIGQSSTICAPTLCGVCPDSAGDAAATRVPPQFASPPADVGSASRTDLSLGRFRLLERIGTGAFGEVWKAHDALLDRLVALKVAHSPVADKLMPSMLEEARLAAQLRHPHIVRVHELDADGNRVFIVSDLIDGCTLETWRESVRPSVRESVAMTEKIARALQHAHDRGVVHRDMKPGNVMVGRDGEPCLVDFGLGMRVAQADQSSTLPVILGTPRYMSPEQARGASHQVDRRADVYSLGVILFELLTGRRPFSGNTPELLKQLQTQAAPRPRRFNRSLSPDLEQICLKCLRRSPSDRYASAQELADDLSQYLAGRPVTARPISLLRRLGRCLRRHPLVTTTAMLLILAVEFSGLAVRWAGSAQKHAVISEGYKKLLQDNQSLKMRFRQARSPAYRQSVKTGDQRRTKPMSKFACYHLACEYALATEAAARDPTLSNEARQKWMQKCRAAACEMLERARVQGYFDPPDCRAQLRNEVLFASLTDEPAFLRLRDSLKDEPS